MDIIKLVVGVSGEIGQYYSIEGLNLFGVNEVSQSMDSNLRYEFLKQLSNRGRFGCIVGHLGMRDLGHSFCDVFGNINNISVERTVIEVHEGDLYEPQSSEIGG